MRTDAELLDGLQRTLENMGADPDCSPEDVAAVLFTFLFVQSSGDTRKDIEAMLDFPETQRQLQLQQEMNNGRSDSVQETSDLGL